MHALSLSASGADHDHRSIWCAAEGQVPQPESSLPKKLSPAGYDVHTERIDLDPELGPVSEGKALHLNNLLRPKASHIRFTGS